MYLAYLDESGDDGYPKTKSQLFALTSTYMNESTWKENFAEIKKIRKVFYKKYWLAARSELHTRDFMANDDRYIHLHLSEKQRVSLLDEYATGISKLKIKVINCVTDKTKITNNNYKVLDNCLNFSIQRVENDLRAIDKKLKEDNKFVETSRFIMIVDPGREAKMISTARRIQTINFIPSQFGPHPYRSEIKKLIEDPLPKVSHQSYFIQISDFIVSVIFLYMKIELGIGKMPSRIPKSIDFAKLKEWLDILKPVLNFQASKKNKYGYGIVCFPN
jgi:hypothetical protein